MTSFNPDRIDMLEDVRENGENPFRMNQERDMSIETFLETYEAVEPPLPDVEYSLVGRVTRYNNFGGISFIDIEDETGSVQVAFSGDNTDEYDAIESISVGDFVLATGVPAEERFDALSLFAESWTIVTKALRNQPSFDGLNEQNTTVDRVGAFLSDDELASNVQNRFDMITEIRDLMTSNGFTEVDTPTLHAVASGADAEKFTTYSEDLDQELYLRVAPELYLKRLVASGYENIFEIGNNFRNEDIDSSHNPEFTMMEVYQAYADWQDMMDLTEQIVLELTDVEEIEQHDILELAQEHVDDTLESAIENANYDENPETEREMAFAIYENEVEDNIEAAFVTGLPASVSPLAKTNENGNPERFELVIDGMEVANGYSEQNDPFEQREAFNNQSGEQDWEYVDDIAYGLPPTGGVGIGIDRLTMIATNTDSIRRIIPFPMHREM